MSTVHIYIESMAKGSPEDDSILRNLMPHIKKRLINQANEARKAMLERKRLRAPAPKVRKMYAVTHGKTSAKSGIKPVKPARGKGPKIVS